MWFNNIRELPKIISSVVRTWTLDNIPEEIYEASKKTAEWFSVEEQKDAIQEVYINRIRVNRRNELQKAYDYFTNELEKEK